AEPAHGIEHLLGDVLQDVEDAQLVGGVGPDLGQGGRVEVGPVGDDQAGQEAPVLQHQEEPPHVRLVVGPDQGKADDLVGDGVGGHKQGEPPQVQLVDAQDAAEVLQGAAAVLGQVEPAQLPVQAVVDVTRGEFQQEVPPHGSAGPLDVEPVLQQAVQD